MGIPDASRDPQFYDGVPARRFVAFLIDTAVILGLWLVAVIVGLVLTVLTAGLGAPLALLVLMGTGFAYRWLMISARSATLGMMIAGIELRDREGRNLDGLTAALHTLGFYLTLAFLPLAIVGWILMAGTPERRVLHDRPLGTVMINRPA